jgi:hypothetical protein
MTDNEMTPAESAAAVVTLGETRFVPLSALRLDPYNPRLPKSLQGQSQDDLAVHLELGFDAFTVAQSIAGHGYFSSEPLIVIPNPDGHGIWLVVEGNRRLTALLGLTDKGIRSQFADPDRWEALAVHSAVTSEAAIPVVVAPSRESVVPIVGFRHISGILQWQPYAQAMYVASLVDEGKTYAEVASLIGIEKKKVSDLYRDQAIVLQAQQLGLQTGNIERAFSLLTVAMNSPKIREHIGAPLGSRLSPGGDPIPAEKVDELRETIGWIFGDENQEPRITDSRQISTLGNVMAMPIGLAALRDGDTLEQAKQKVADKGLDPRERLIKRLSTGKNALLAAADDIAEYPDDTDVVALLEEIDDALSALRSVT